MRTFRAGLVATVLLTFWAGVALADGSDFEGLTTDTSVNGQAGWTVEDSFGHDFVEGGKAANLDEEVIDDGSGSNNVWRISNAVAYSEYASQPFSYTAPLVAGETNSYLYNDYGTDHTQPYSPPHPGATSQSSQFFWSVDFSSATGAAQDGLSISLSPSAKQSTVRMSYVNIFDDGANGFDLTFYDTSNGDVEWNDTLVASDLAYDEVHTLAMWITFVDGVTDNGGGDVDGNDIVRIYVDGSLVHTGTTWESYYYVEGEGVTEPRLQAVDSLLFRVAGTAVPATAGNGFYFDNVEVSNVPEPATMGLLGLGLAALVARRRRAK